MRSTLYRGIRRWYLTLAAAAVMLLCMIGTAPQAQAAIGDVYNISIQGTQHFSVSFALLNKIDALREENTISKFTVLDDSLTTSAMQRAAELSCLYNNEMRPNQADALSINTKAEASAILRSSNIIETDPGKIADIAMDAVKADSELLGQMLNSVYNSIGIGCFSVGNDWYWVFLFSKERGTFKTFTDITTAKTVTVTELGRTNGPVPAVNGEVVSSGSKQEIYEKSQAAVAVYWQDATVNGLTNATRTPVDPKSFFWTSSNPAVADVAENGTVTAKTAGEAVITAIPKVKNGLVEGVSLIFTVKEIGFEVELEKTTYTYTGKAIKPDVTVYDNTGTLEEDEDYTVSYKKNKKAGYGTVTVTGIGDYAGLTETLQFRIRPAKMKSLQVTSPSAERIRLTWKKNSQASGYQIQIATSSNMKTDRIVKNVSAKKLKLTVKNLESDETYYVRIRAYKKVSGGERIYAAWSKKIKIKVK